MLEEIISMSDFLWMPSTRQFDISRWIKFDGMIRLDLEKNPPVIYRETNNSLVQSIASEDELTLIYNGLKSLPLFREYMYKYEIHAIFSELEKSIIRANVPSFIELLLMADDPVRTDRLIPYLKQITHAGILSKDRFQKITGIEIEDDVL